MPEPQYKGKKPEKKGEISRDALNLPVDNDMLRHFRLIRLIFYLNICRHFQICCQTNKWTQYILENN